MELSNFNIDNDNVSKKRKIELSEIQEETKQDLEYLKEMLTNSSSSTSATEIYKTLNEYILEYAEATDILIEEGFLEILLNNFSESDIDETFLILCAFINMMVHNKEVHRFLIDNFCKFKFNKLIYQNRNMKKQNMIKDYFDTIYMSLLTVLTPEDTVLLEGILGYVEENLKEPKNVTACLGFISKILLGNYKLCETFVKKFSDNFITILEGSLEEPLYNCLRILNIITANSESILPEALIESIMKLSLEKQILEIVKEYLFLVSNLLSCKLYNLKKLKFNKSLYKYFDYKGIILHEMMLYMILVSKNKKILEKFIEKLIMTLTNGEKVLVCSILSKLYNKMDLLKNWKDENKSRLQSCLLKMSEEKSKRITTLASKVLKKHFNL